MPNKYKFRIERTKSLLEMGNQFADGKPTAEYGAHTLVKLITISSYANQFARIAHGQQARASGYDSAVYVDLFAGPGVVQIKERPNCLVAGSPIAVAMQDKFDRYVMVEQSERKAKVLDSRLVRILPRSKFSVIQGDCNERVDDIIAAISMFKKPLVLLFCDPEGLEANFHTLESISRMYPATDFVINLTAGADRARGRLLAQPAAGVTRFETFLPAGEAEQLLSGEHRKMTSQQAFVNAVMDDLGKEVGEIIPVVDSGGRHQYDILAFSRAGAGSWGNILEYIRDMLRGFDGNEAISILDIISGGRGTLDEFFETT